MTPNRSLGYGLALGLILGLAGPAAAETETAWDQEKVTEIAQQFAKATADLAHEMNVNNSTLDSTMTAETYIVYNDLLLLKRHARALSRVLAKGEGAEDTRNLYHRIGLIIRQTQNDARYEPYMHSDQVQAKASVARGLARQLDGYYGEDSFLPLAATDRERMGVPAPE